MKHRRTIETGNGFRKLESFGMSDSPYIIKNLLMALFFTQDIMLSLFLPLLFFCGYYHIQSS